MMNIFLYFFFLMLGLSSVGYAYPQFIGHGYASCMTCHYNGAGGGPLTDYGRGFYASEIAQKPFFRTATTEKLIAESGFFGASTARRLGEKFKPFIELRQLYFLPDVSANNSEWREIKMRQSFGFSYIFDPDEKWIFTGELGTVPEPSGANSARSEESRTLISREHYLRHNIKENWWLYYGFMDKPYGIRLVDHTAVTRSKIGLGQNDQSHGIMAQRSVENSELFAFLFFGNLNQEKSLRQKGLSIYYDYETSRDTRIGSSFLGSTNDFVRWLRLGAHVKRGLGKGHSILFDTGVAQDSPVSSGSDKLGAYALIEGTLRMSRGVYFSSRGEYYKKEMAENIPEQLRMGLNLSYFPMQRIEINLGVLQTRMLSASSVKEDTTSCLGQLHLSF